MRRAVMLLVACSRPAPPSVDLAPAAYRDRPHVKEALGGSRAVLEGADRLELVSLDPFARGLPGEPFLQWA